ncbi:hypothetical protein AB2301_17410 [Vibrio cholerae]|uniref:hypothetical protein n=1 Tax=Vibrio cholerae TaxID=666 RepID=UPI0034B09CD3|nr:hypothetical protein [Vibrio cholerae]
MANFSCRFIVKNNSDSNLLCSSRSTDIVDGQWHNINVDPPSKILSHSELSFDLNDKGGTSRGAEGTVTFEAWDKDSKQKIQIALTMSCPLIGDNKATYTITPDNVPFVVSAKVPSQSGHPIDGIFEIQQF